MTLSRNTSIQTFRDDCRYPRWFSSVLINLIKEKLKYYRKWKIYGRLWDYNTFSFLRECQKWVQQECYDKFILNAKRKIKVNSKHFWKFVKSKTSSPDIPDTMFYNAVISNDGRDICNLFNGYFRSVFDPPVPGYSCAPQSSIPLTIISTIVISIDLVKKYIKSLDINKG